MESNTDSKPSKKTLYLKKMKTLKNISWTFILGILTVLGMAQSDDVLKGHCHINQAEMYRTYSNYGEAIRYYEAGIKIFTDFFDQNHPLVNINYVAIGKSYLETGDTEKAKLYCNNALKNIQKYFPEGAIAAQCLECLGLIAQSEKKYSDALQYYEQALAIQDNLWGENHYASSTLYFILGDFFLNQNQFQQAKIYFEKIKDTNNDESDVFQQENLAKYYEAVGKWHFQQNKLDEAAPNFNKSIAIYKNINGEKHPTIANVYLQLADVFYQKNELEQALIHYDSAYFSFQDFSKQNLDIESYDTCRCNQTLIATTIGKAMVFEQKIKQNKSENDFKTALKHYQQAAHKVILSVQFFGKDALHRQQIIHKNKTTFVNAINLSYQLYELTTDEKYIQTAFDFVNDYKALTLQIQQKKAKIMSADVPEDLLREQEKWKTKIADLKFEIYQAETKNLSSLAADKKQELLKVITEQTASQTAFENNFWYVEDSVFSNNLINFEQVSSLLNQETVLLNYIFDASKNQLLIFFFSNKKTNFQVVKLPQTFVEDVEKFHYLLQSSLLARADKKQLFIEKGHELYQYLIEPISDLIADKKRLIIIRDDVLHLLPFDVLLKDKQANDFQNLNYLIKDFEITYHYSTGLWYNSLNQQWQGKSNSLLAFAPVFDGVENLKISMADDAFRCFIQDEIQVPLPHSEIEVLSIQKVLGQSTQNTVLLRAEATKTQFLQRLQQPHRFVHVASHSFANYDNAQFSGIACFISPNTSPKEYMLYINEIENLKIKTDLVVLSSCESGIGQLLQGEGLLGINRSFLYAGVPNTLFSLWKVQDEATALLMIEFYKNVQQNKRYSEALRQAKLTLLQDEKTAIPIFWASFILMGR